MHVRTAFRCLLEMNIPGLYTQLLVKMRKNEAEFLRLLELFKNMHNCIL